MRGNGIRSGFVRHRGLRLLASFSLLFSVNLLAASGAGSDVPRHPLELQALQHPEAVLAKLPAEIAAAEERADHRAVALLYLAKTNACRVVANWSCQRASAASARTAAARASEPLLAVRALIGESRASMALQDYSRGEQLLGEAEAQLQRTPAAELLADVYLAYSSMSNALDKPARERDYASRGLQALGDLPEPLIRARLLRNEGRGAAELGDHKAAHASLEAALRVAQSVRDPKLSAELDLELARLANIEGDFAGQRASGERVLLLAEQFRNPQLRALGHEVIGIAAMSEDKLAEAEAALQAADQGFIEAGLEAEQRRVLRELVRVSLQRDPSRSDLGPQMLRLMSLDERLDQRDRALAGDDFEARLRYAEQDFELQRLAKESELASARERVLATSNRVRLLLIAIGSIGLLVIALFLVLQRRAYARLKRGDAALEASEKRLRAVTDNIPAIISHVDREQRYTFANAFMSRVFKVDEHNIVGRTVREVRGDVIYATLMPHIDTAMRGQAVSFEGVAEFSGQAYHYQTSYVPDLDRDGTVNGFFAMTFDITRLKLAEQQLEREARFDALTGVANRRHFEERLALAIARGRRQPVALAVLYLDIDHLKQINDQHGHAVGDIVIREFASRLVTAVREGDLIARLGGDEFVVLSEHVEAAQAVEAAERTAAAVIAAMQTPIIAGDLELQVSTSIGIAETQSVNDAEALIAEADRALYAAKAAGRNTWRRGSTVVSA